MKLTFRAFKGQIGSMCHIEILTKKLKNELIDRSIDRPSKLGSGNIIHMGLLPTKTAIQANELASETNIVSHMRKKITNFSSLLTREENKNLLTSVELDSDVIGVLAKEFSHGARESNVLGGNWSHIVSIGVNINCNISLAVVFCDISPLFTFSLVSKRHRKMILENFSEDIAVLSLVVKRMNTIHQTNWINYPAIDVTETGEIVEAPAIFIAWDEQTLRYLSAFYNDRFAAHYDK